VKLVFETDADRRRLPRRRPDHRQRRHQLARPPRHAAVFRPDIVTRPNRYIWLGTNKLYDAFTFLFEKTEHGWFQAHIYKFDETTTTFIVECPEHVWLAHGLDRADQARVDRLLRAAVRRQPAGREADDQRAPPARLGLAELPARALRPVVAASTAAATWC
jgi:hypothetical protein